MKIFYEPDKYWWQFWKKSRYLIENKEFEIVNRTIKIKKVFKGNLQIEYEFAPLTKLIHKNEEVVPLDLIRTTGINEDKFPIS